MSDLFDRLTASLMVVGTYLAFLVKAVLAALREVPIVNATLYSNASLAYYGMGRLEGFYTWDSISDAWFNLLRRNAD